MNIKRINKNDEFKILEILPIGTAVYDKNRNLVYSNRVAERICNKNVPKNLESLEISKDEIRKLQTKSILSTSKNFYYQILVKPLDKLNNGCVVVFNDNSNKNSLWYLATHDKMTGLFSRAFLETEVERLKDSRDFPMSVIFADVDNLKVVNDKYGHMEGDKLIIAAGYVLKQCTRKYDILARVGGDEFLILLPKTDGDSVRKIVERIRRKLNLLNTKRKKVTIGLSIGYSVIEQGSDLKKGIKQADKSMYKEKSRHKKSVKK